MSAGNVTGGRIKKTMYGVSGPLVKENDEMVLVDNKDGTATWYAKNLIYGQHRTPAGIITFECTNLAAVRNVRMS